MRMDITVKSVRDLFKEKISELQEEPEFQWKKERIKYAVNENGEPSVKLAVGNLPLDYDLWQGLRNPALVGLYPVGLEEIWEFYANRRKTEVDESGRQTVFQIPRSFNFARKNYTRAVIISIMLPFSVEVIEEYTQLFGKKGGSSHMYSRMFQDVDLILDKATTRVATNLITSDTVIVPMNNENVKSISLEAVPSTRQGAAHGPGKDVNYSHKSIAVLMGLGQFGVSRIVFRDEIANNKVERAIGPLKSIIIFDKEKLVKDGSDGIIHPGEAWRGFICRLSDFTDATPDINKYRFCSYIPYNEEACRKCIDSCPSGAQTNSTPTAYGSYPEKIKNQTHRFWEGKLQFDFARCCEERGQMATLFPEWSCSRCISICAAAGRRRINATKNFYKEMLRLTKESK